MARKRSRVLDFAVYCAVRVIVSLVQALSWSQVLTAARWFGWLAYHVDRRHRQVAMDNLRYSFPDMSEAERDALVRDNYVHWVRVIFEMIRLPRVLRAWNLDEYFSYPCQADYQCAVDWTMSDRPRLVLTGHFGNFEALSYAIGLYGATGVIVARRLDNPYLERFVQTFRQHTGQQIVDKNHDYERILQQLREKGTVGLVGDQDAGQRGMFVDFLGRPASTFKSIALLSLEYQAPIVVIGAARIGEPMHFRIYVEDVILPEEYANHPDPARAITERYSQALERMVRRHPEQYFWLHRRWKHQPKVREKKQAA
jgi:KDO2-lipid IV(A) lauroyltransferase